MRKYVVLFSLAGLALPCLLTVIWMALEKHNGAYLWVSGKIEVLQLLVWPSSLFMLATAGHQGIDYKMLALSTAVNIGIYALIGFVIWYGVHKQHWILLACGVLVTLGWYKLLTL